MKKVLPIALLALSAFSATALAHNGYIYMGADGGIFNADFDTSYIDQIDTIAQNYQSTVTQHGYTGGLQLGYHRNIRRSYFIGGEISGNFNSSVATNQEGANSSAFTDKTKIGEHMDFTLVPGVKLTKTVSAFMKLGLSVAWIKNNLNSPIGFTPAMTYYANNNTALGFAAGLGVSKQLCKHMSVFTEADYHDYGTVSFQNFQNYTTTYTHAAKVFSYDVLAGAAYRFV